MYFHVQYIVYLIFNIYILVREFMRAFNNSPTQNVVAVAAGFVDGLK